MSAVDFDAFALPNGVEATQSLLDYDAQGVRVRYVSATSDWIGGLADALLHAREELMLRAASDIAAVLGRVGSRFLHEGDPLRGQALQLLPATAGLSEEMAVAVLDGMAADWTRERLLAVVRSELRTEHALDGFVHTVERSAMAVGPSLCVQIVAGSVPGVGVTALLRSLLLKGPTLLKPGRGDVVLPVLFARALREADPGLADALAVVYWRGGERSLESAALARADVVTAYGSDGTVAELRLRTPVTARFVAYHHRVSVGIVGRDALSDDEVDRSAAGVAESVALFDQRGCVSPQVVFVEEGGVHGPEGFAAALAEQFRRLETRLPSVSPDSGEASARHQVRGTAELMAALGEVTVLHGGDAGWTVILDGTASLGPSPGGRCVRVRGVSDASEVPALVKPFGGHLQTVGVSGLGGRLSAIARALGRVGASRIVPFGSVAFPPPWWHHDGRGPLLDLLRWVDLEGE